MKMTLQRFMCMLTLLVDFFGTTFPSHLQVRECHDELLANKCVNLANTNLTTLSSKAWKRNVTQFYAFRNRIEVFNIDEPEILTHIDISHNELKRLPVDILSRAKNLIYLNVAHNNIYNISSDSLGLNYFIKILDLSYNKLTNISEMTFAKMDLERLFLNGNELSSLEKNMFKNCTNLERLNLANNVIETVIEDTFNDLVKLRSLDLSGNQLKKLPHLGRMPMLKVLDVSKNNLVFVEVQDLPKLFLFILNNNELPNLEMSMFPISVQKKGKVDLGFNRFSSVNVTILLEFFDPRANSVLLDGNPWACDIEICPLVETFPTARLWFSSDPRCSGPRDLAGKFLDDEAVIRRVCRVNNQAVALNSNVTEHIISTTEMDPTTYADSTINDVIGTDTSLYSSLSQNSTLSNPYTVRTSTTFDGDYDGDIVN